jgi:hypothetical protein
MVEQSNKRTISYCLSKDCLHFQVQSGKKEEQGQHKGKSSPSLLEHNENGVPEKYRRIPNNK